MEEISLSHYLFKNQLFLKVETIKNFQEKKLNALVWSCLGSQLDLSLLSFHLIRSVLYCKKKVFFQKKRPTDCNLNSFWIVTVQDWPKTSPANACCPLGTIDFSNIVDIDNLTVESSKKVLHFC